MRIKMLRILICSTVTALAAGWAASPAGGALIVPQYSSLPGAPAQIYLDFTGTDNFGRWGSFNVGSVPAYDVDGDALSYSGLEFSYIRQVFIRVAEKFSPFNINVTTIDPGNRTNRETAHVMIGGDGDWYTSVAGGVAYIGGFYNTSSNTAWVFPDNLGGGNPKSVAEAAAHEAGHLFGLRHQSRWTQNQQGEWVQQVYSTNNNDPNRRPVMGSSYGSTRGLWWHGTTTSRFTLQDDVAVLANASNAFGYRDDDHGDTPLAATPLSSSLGGETTPVGGVIERMDDLDLFSFMTGAGEVSFWTVLAEYGAMLDSSLWLYDVDGNLLESAATSSLSESLTTTLLAGSYFIGVSGAGNYGDLGQYTLMGSIVPLVHTPEPTAAAGLVLAGAALLGRNRKRLCSHQ